jgi:hypothetical protein
MKTDRPIYILKFRRERALTDSQETRAIRELLKRMLRSFGLRAISIRTQSASATASTPPAPATATI